MENVISRDNGIVPLVMKLYHGSYLTAPKLIYDSHEGFDINFSKGGMWGRGIYFAVNASYSCNGYSYKVPPDSVY
jgi:hypothetical protein